MTANTSSSPAPRQQAQDDEIDLLALFATLWDQIWLITATTAVFMVIGVAYALVASPVYKANAIVQVEEKSPSLPGMSDVTSMFGSESDAITEIELIKSRKVIGAAVDKLNLDIQVGPRYFPLVGRTVARRFTGDVDELNTPVLGLGSYAWGGERIKVSRFDVPFTQFNKAHTLVAEDDGFTLLSPDNEALLSGKVGNLIRTEGYELYIPTLHAHPGTRFTLSRLRRLSAIIALQEKMAVSERGKDSGILALSIEDTDPERAEEILNVIASTYLRQNVERQSAEAAKSLDFLREQLPNIKKDLEEAERKFNAYQVKVGSVNISAEAEALLDQVVDIESGIAELQLQQAELDRKYTRDHPAYQAWREQMAEQVARKAEFNTRIKGLP
jgi:tyrosine-protein kinase Etk/Wzc